MAGNSDLILRRARSARLEGWPQTRCARPRPRIKSGAGSSRLAQAGERLRMRATDTSTQNHNLVIRRHREERSDEAIQRVRVSALDCFASLAMTRLHESPFSDSGY